MGCNDVMVRPSEGDETTLSDLITTSVSSNASDAGNTDRFPSIGQPLTAAYLKGGGAYAVMTHQIQTASHLKWGQKNTSH